MTCCTGTHVSALFGLIQPHTLFLRYNHTHYSSDICNHTYYSSNTTTHTNVCIQIFAGCTYISRMPPHLTIFVILILWMAACSCKSAPYAYKFSHSHFRKHPLICKIRENKVLRKFVCMWYVFLRYNHTAHISDKHPHSVCPGYKLFTCLRYLQAFTRSPALGMAESRLLTRPM